MNHKVEAQAVRQAHRKASTATGSADSSRGRSREKVTSTGHDLLFYEDEDSLCQRIAEIAGAGLARGEPTLIIATAEHNTALARCLEKRCFDVARATATGQLLLIDAREMLDTLILDGDPNWELFDANVGGAVRAARAKHPDGQLRAYGEMVDLLWARGNTQGAIRLEEMWNVLRTKEDVALVCGYAAKNVDAAEHAHELAYLHGAHSRVLRDGVDDEARAHELANGTSPSERDGEDEHPIVALDSAMLLRAMRRAEAVAERERTRLHELFMQSPALIVILRGPEHIHDFVNAAAAKLFGAENLIGKSIREALPDTTPERLRMLDHVFTTGERYVADAVPSLRDWDGNAHPYERFFNVADEPYRDVDGRIAGIMSFGFDVTDAVLARRKVEAAAEALGVANRTKDEFLATVSHELRTPLNAILGWVRMLREGSLTESKRARALATIEKNAAAQARLVEDLLDVSRIITGKLHLDMSTIDVCSMVEHGLDTVRPAAAAKGIELVQTVDPAAGPVLGDPQRLQQVVWNLVTNAVKFTPEGGTVRVIVRNHESSLEIVVADDGQGIDPDFAPHVFERFRQADSTSARKYGGLGLGLAIVRHLVELHGGTVRVESDGLGKGSAFTVTLPIATSRTFAAARASHHHDAPKAEPRPPAKIAGVRVVVVDDERDARDLVAELLVGRNATVWTAANASEAIRLVAEHRPDVVVSDIGMPGEDGYALIKRIRALPSSAGGKTPAVALTAYARVEDRTKALGAGFDMHLPKPVEPKQLLAALTTLTAMAKHD